VEKIVLNASPLILLCNSELSFILPELFTEIVAPEAVWQEIVDGPHLDRAAQMLPGLAWLKKESISPVPDVVRWDLGTGETEVLSFALKHSGYTPVLDDMLAKKCARSLGIQTMGTGTILILAKEHGLIESVEQSLRKLQNAGLWISEPIIQLLRTYLKGFVARENWESAYSCGGNH
jgi:predicted nucleic acid-binding protein